MGVAGAVGAVLASALLAQPAARIDRFAVVAQLEIHAGAVAGGEHGRAQGLARSHVVAHPVQQGFVVLGYLSTKKSIFEPSEPPR